MTTKKYVIFDMDGTIADLTHRLHFIKSEPKDWDGFFEACDKDFLNQWSIKLAEALGASGWIIIIVSGRPDRVRDKTIAWLDRKGFPFSHIELVRRDGDHAPDDLLKKQWLERFGRKDEILFVIDDRQRVVDMWRENGLVCLQCCAWKE